MKKSILLICLITFSAAFITNAQKAASSNKKTKLTALYFNCGVGGTFNGSISGAGLNFILSNNWGGSVSTNLMLQKAKELPSNYRPGFVIFGDGIPNDEIESYSIRLMKGFPTNTIKVRFGLEGGVAMIKYTAAHFTPIPTNSNSGGGWFGINLFGGTPSNYNVSYTTENSVGASFRAKLEFPLARWIGFEFAAISNINQFQSYVGGEIHLIIGLVRGKHYPTKAKEGNR